MRRWSRGCAQRQRRTVCTLHAWFSRPSRGATLTELVHVTDVLPTLLELALGEGAQLLTGTLDGISAPKREKKRLLAVPPLRHTRSTKGASMLQSEKSLPAEGDGEGEGDNASSQGISAETPSEAVKGKLGKLKKKATRMARIKKTMTNARAYAMASVCRTLLVPQQIQYYKHSL